MKRRQVLALPAGLALIPLGSLVLVTVMPISVRGLLWGGSGFNVPNDEIKLRLDRINRSLEAEGKLVGSFGLMRSSQTLKKVLMV